MQQTIQRTPARTITDLIARAEDKGLRVLWAAGMPERGRWVPSRQTIILRDGMTYRRTLSTLAHELGHALHDAGERRAWEYAARILIDRAEYERAEAVCPSAGAMAVELGVTVEVIHGCRALIRHLVVQA